MADYSKFDNLVDSDDEGSDGEDVKNAKAEALRQRQRADERQEHSSKKQEIERWLKPRIKSLLKPKQEEDPGAPPELDEDAGQPPRRVTDEERGVLAMFLAVVHVEEKDANNITRHHEIMNLARQHRWIEEDPGTLELMCQLHRGVIKEASEGMMTALPADGMADMVISAINTLAAPSKAGVKSGYGKIYELFALIGDPQTKEAWKAREKYAKKEYAIEALLDSMVPGVPDEDFSPFASIAKWGVLLLCLVLFIAFCLWKSWTSASNAGSDSPLPAAPVPGPLTTSASQEL